HLHQRCDNTQDAQAVLQMALEVSPNAIHRHKAVGAVALSTGDLETAEAAYAAVVRKGRSGFTQDPDDHLTLSRIYLRRGKHAQALDTLAETRKTFPGATVQAAACTLESLAQREARNPRDAKKALDEALAMANAEGIALPGEAELELARACYLDRREHEGAALVRRVVSNNHDDEALLEAVRTMFRGIDRAEQGESLI